MHRLEHSKNAAQEGSSSENDIDDQHFGLRKYI